MSRSVYAIIYTFILLQSSIFATTLDIDTISHRVSSHLTIGDPQTGLAEVQDALKSCSEESQDYKTLLILKVRCLAKLCDEGPLLQTYKELTTKYPLEAQNPDLLEDVTWAIITKAQKSDSPLIRIEGTFAAFISNDAKGIPIFERSLHDQNVKVRELAYDLAKSLRDDSILKMSLLAVKEDPSIDVKVAAIEALGSMRADCAEAELKHIIEDKSTTLEEKQAASDALVQILPDFDIHSFNNLISSNRAYLRIVACNLALQSNNFQLLNQIATLLDDTNVEVRIAALQTIGTRMRSQDLHNSRIYNTIISLSQHSEPRLSISALWILALKGKEKDSIKSQDKLIHYLDSPSNSTRLLAAAALCHVGTPATESLLKALNHHDPFVRINIAVGLIQNRSEVQKASSVLDKALSLIKERISITNEGLFSWFGPSTIPHVEGMPRLPEAQDFLSRLELYSILATCEAQNLNDKIRSFLKERTWGISGASASLLIQEGDSAITDYLRLMLHDDAKEIALQAAYILALYDQDPEALNIFQEMYPKATREQKEQIIFAMGAIGEMNTIPFLVQVLDEPFQTLRIRAATAIIQCLFH